MSQLPHIAFLQLYHISENIGGGAEVQAWFLAKELAARGYWVSYLCQSVDKTKAGSKEVLNGVDVYWIKQSPGYPVLNILSYYRAVKKANPDFVLERMASGYGAAAAHYCRKFSKRYIWVCTDNISCFQDPFLRKLKKLLQEGKHLNLVKRTVIFANYYSMHFLRSYANRNIDLPFYQNKFQKEKIAEFIDQDAYLMISGHALPGSSASSNQARSAQSVLWCANLGIHKRPALFIQLARTMPNQDITFTMVGGHGDKAYVENLMKDKPDRLNYLGRLPFEEALKQFDQTSLFINTSNAGGDGFPNTFIQAWLRGVPTVTMGFDPNQLIQRQELGFVCKDIQDMRDKVQQLLADPALYSKISQNCISYATQNHSIKKMTDHFLDVVLNESTPLH